jgi:hypothetical protein
MIKSMPNNSRTRYFQKYGLRDARYFMLAKLQKTRGKMVSGEW